MKKGFLLLVAGLLIAMGAAQASLVTGMVGDATTWKENGDLSPTFQGGLFFDGLLAFSLTSSAAPAVGDTVAFAAPSVLLSGVQADQWSQMLGWGMGACITPTFADEHCASAGLGVKEIGRDFSAIWAYDIRAGNFTADAGGRCYFDPNTNFCFPAEGVVNGSIASARNLLAGPVYMTDGRWLSLTPLLATSPPVAVSEPASLALAVAGLAGVGASRRRRTKGFILPRYLWERETDSARCVR